MDIQAGLVSRLFIPLMQFADPIYKGRLNPTVSEMIGDKFADFSEEEWAMIKGSSELQVYLLTF